MKITYHWEPKDIIPGKSFRDSTNQNWMIVDTNFYDNRGPVFNKMIDGHVASIEWMTSEQMADHINYWKGVPV